MNNPVSQRLTFKPLTHNDTFVFEELVCDPHVKEYLMEGQELTNKECTTFIEKGIKLKERTSLGLYLLYFENRLIGYCGFMETHPPSDDLDVVYAFTKNQTGQGFATEVCKALASFYKSSGFKGGLTAVVNPENVASIKVLEKTNFKNKGFCVGELNHLLRFRLSD